MEIYILYTYGNRKNYNLIYIFLRSNGRIAINCLFLVYTANYVILWLNGREKEKKRRKNKKKSFIYAGFRDFVM